MLLNANGKYKRKKQSFACKAFTTLLLLPGYPLLITTIFLFPGCRTRYLRISLKGNLKDDTDLAIALHLDYKPQSEHSFQRRHSPLRLGHRPGAITAKNKRKLPGAGSFYTHPDKVRQPVELIIRSTYAEINQLIKHNQVDAVALVCAWTSSVEQKGKRQYFSSGCSSNQWKTQNNSLLIVNKKRCW